MTLIERLRKPDMDIPRTAQEAADLLESQAARIAELEDQLNAERDAKYALQDKLETDPQATSYIPTTGARRMTNRLSSEPFNNNIWRT